MHNKKYDAVTEFAKINTADRDETILVSEYAGDEPRLMIRDKEIHILCPKNITYVQEEGIADSIANGTIFDDASLLNDQADYMQKTILPMNAIVNKHGVEPKKIRILITGVMGRINDDGNIEISLGDMENGKNFLDDITSGHGCDHVNKMCDHYLGIKNEDENMEGHCSLPLDIRRDIHDLIDEIDSITDIEPEDEVTDADFDPWDKPYDSSQDEVVEEPDTEEVEEPDNDSTPLDNEDEEDDESDDDYDAYDESYYIETTSVGNMNPEQKAKHEERKMHKTAIRNAEKMGYDPNKAKREAQAEAKENQPIADHFKKRMMEDKAKRQRTTDPAEKRELDQKIKSSKERVDRVNEPTLNKRKRVPRQDTFESSVFGFPLVTKGSTVDASGRKHEYDTLISVTDGTIPDSEQGGQKTLLHSKDTLHGKHDFDYIHNHEVGHMAQIDHGMYDSEREQMGLESGGKKSMGLAEDYAFKCAKWFAKHYKSKLNSHDIDPRELHADYLSARKVGFNRVYKSIKQMYSGREDKPNNDFSQKNIPNGSDTFIQNQILLNELKKKYNIDFDLEKYIKNKSYREMIKKQVDDGDRESLNDLIKNATTISRIERKDARIEKTTGDYRALFIQDMMWLHKGQRNRCSMKYPEWTPEEKKAFMESYVDEILTEDDIIEMEIFKEHMTFYDDNVYTEFDDNNTSYYDESFRDRHPKRLKPIPRDVISYITVEMNAIRDSNDQAMIAGYCSAKLELVDFYLNCIDTQDARYIVPHNRQYLVQMQSELNDLLKRILQIKPINKYDRIWGGIL